jgi:hypothetical protein
MTISDIAISIINDNIKQITNMIPNYNKPFRYEPSQGLVSVSIPYMSPFQALYYLASKAISSTGNGYNYIFFETMDGFIFGSLENLISQPSVAKYVYQPKMARSLRNQKNTAQEIFSADEMRIMESFDTAQSISQGAHGNSLLVHDVLGGSVSFKSTSFGDMKNITLDTNPLIDSTNLLSQNASLAKMRLIPANIGIDDNIMSRNIQMQQLYSHRIRFTASGVQALRTGQVINFDVPSYISNDSPQKVSNETLDKFYSGRYIIASLKHKLQPSKYSVAVEICKDSLGAAAPTSTDWS